MSPLARAARAARAARPTRCISKAAPCQSQADNEILVRIGAAGVNRGDCMQRVGLYPPPPGAPDIMGLEFAGTVVALGAKADKHAIGDRVAALVAGGGYAEYACVHQDHFLPVPDT
jgi:NADPH2:quinone reductase